MGRRTVLLIAALVVAALGTTLVFLYVNGADKRANADAELVDVLAASAQIPAGETGRQAEAAGLFVKKQVNKSAVPEGAISQSTPILDLVALAPILPGQLIQQGAFGQPTATNQLGLQPGQFAMSLSMGDPQRVAGFLVPGSKVAVFTTYTPKTGGAGVTTRVLLPSVIVVATGNSTATTTTTTKDSSGNAQTTQLPLALLTLAVDQKMFQKIVTAQATGGTLQFGLLNDKSKIDPGDTGTNINNLFN